MRPAVRLVLLLLCWPMMARAAHDAPLLAIYSGCDVGALDRAAKCGVTILYPSISWDEPAPFLKPFCDEAHKRGVKIYPSLAAAYDGYQEKQSDFAKAHPQFWEKRKSGRLIDRGEQVSLSWGYPEVRAYKVKKFTEMIVSGGCDGVSLDYTRFFGSDAGYSDIIVSDFKRKTGRDAFKISEEDPQWVQFRAAYVTQFLEDLRRSLHAANKELKLIACVGPDPQACLLDSLQDWGGWLDRGLIDGVLVMIYQRDTNEIARQVIIARDAIKGRVPLVSLIAPAYDNLDTAPLLEEGAYKSLAAGADGVGFYHIASLDRLKLWDAVARIGGRDVSQIRAEPTNLILHGGFEGGAERWAIGDGTGVDVSNERFHSGKSAIHLKLGGERAVRQLVDRGFFGAAQSLCLAGFVRASQLSADAKIRAEVSVAYEAGDDLQFQVPIATTAKKWEPFQVSLPIRGLKGLKFIIVSLVASGAEGDVWLDDLSMSLSATKVAASTYAVKEAEKPVKPPGDVNLALGQPTSASSFLQNGYESWRAVDGNLANDNYDRGSAWESQRPAKNQWLKIYLPRMYLVTRVRMLNPSYQSCYRTRQYRIEVSTDDRTWKQIAQGELADDGSTWTEIETAPVTARYIRFVGVSGFNLDYTVGLKEIEVR